MAGPTQEDQFFLKANSEKVEIKAMPRLRIENVYFKQGLAGTHPILSVRKGVHIRLIQALSVLPDRYGFILFDAFRSIETQWAIWHQMFAHIKKDHPRWTDQEVFQETRKFISNPSEKSRFPVPPHNAGSAIDIGLTDELGNLLEMGSSFDEITERSETDYFDRIRKEGDSISKSNWTLFSERRRILRETLAQAGFTNYPGEWWHFDLGSCLWAEQVKASWFYSALE